MSASIQEILKDAMGHHQAGRLDDAERLYRQVLAADARHADSLHLLGGIFYHRKQYVAAAELIRQAIGIKKDLASYHNNLGLILNDQGKFDEAAARYRQAVALKADYAAAYNNLGITLQRQGRMGEALECYRQVAVLRPDDAAVRNNLGFILHGQDKFDEAIVHYERALVLKPDFAIAHNNLGNSLKEQGKPNAAIACYERAVAIDPVFALAHSNLGNTLKEQGKPDAALACYARALAIDPDMVDAHYSTGEILQKKGLTDQAIPHLRRCLELDPSDTYGVRLFLANLGVGEMPERASEAHVQYMYVQRARSWDEAPYKGHELVANALKRLHGKPDKIDILDAGCGTGLVGDLVRGLARRLDGVDLSPAMLEKARARNIYDELWEGDLVETLARQKEKYDAVTCAATLIHFRDLRPAFHAARGALRDGGLFVMTLFPDENEDAASPASATSLGRAGCYVHGRKYIRSVAEEAGFSVETLESAVHEYHKGEPLMGLVVGLRRNQN